MRTAILVGCDFIAQAITPNYTETYPEGVGTLIGIVVTICMAFDIVDFFRGNRG